MMHTTKLLQSGILSVLLAGCASPREIRETDVSATFSSAQSAALLTQCIDRNTDGYALNSLRTEIKNTGQEPIEIVVWNGHFVHTIVQISSAKGGSTATFRFGGAALKPDYVLELMTTGCG